LTEVTEQLALVQALLSEWPTIRLLMGQLSPMGEKQLALCAGGMKEPSSPEQVQRVTDDLLELTLESPAHSFVLELIRRCSSPIPDDGPRMVELRQEYSMVKVPVGVNEVEDQIAGTTIDLASQIPKHGEPVEVPVLFCTNRMAGNGDFSGEPSKELNFGLAVVTIPVVHRVAHIESPRWWSLFPKFKGPDRFIQLIRIESLSQVELQTEIARAIGTARAKEILIFLHGYNVTFEQAARRAGQIAYDLAFGGVVLLFSWPSLGVVPGYGGDAERAADSGLFLARFLKSLEGGPWTKVHLLAHSMGNRVMLNGLAEVPDANLTFGETAFIAADVGIEQFEQKFPKFQQSIARATLYVSRHDRALALSRELHKLNRIGFVDLEPYICRGLETIDASLVDTSLLGHSYFGDDRNVLMDIGGLLQGLSPLQRRLKQVADKLYWSLPR
jgi:esterase/lipase superfamily enzyme